MELIYVKEVDKSLLYQGFTIRTALLNSFLGIFGKLDIGEMRQNFYSAEWKDIFGD